MVQNVDLPIKECINSKAVRQDEDSAQTLIQKEIDRGYVIGPLETLPFETFRVSPIGIAIGKYSDKKRLILDLSAPHNDDEHLSINSLIDKTACSMTYVKIDDAIHKIQEYGKGAIMCKADLTDAFKQLPILPSQYHLFCFKFREMYFYFTRLTFGCRSSPKIFDHLSQAICWIATNNYSINCIFHLLDDFLTIDKPDTCGERTMALLMWMFKRLNIELSAHKTLGPSEVLEYLGIILDSNRMETRLPVEKIKRMESLIVTLQSSKSCTKRQLLQILGHFNFACSVIHPGRSFLSYLIKLSTTVTQLHHYVKWNSDCRDELNMWSHFLKSWNGISVFHDRFYTNASSIHLITDAASTLGFGGYFNGSWFSEPWPQTLQDVMGTTNLSMAFLELYPIVVASVLWGSHWKGKKIQFNCDNMATVDILNKTRSKELNIMKLMRRLTFCAMTDNFSFCAMHISGKSNIIGDSLSRLQIQRFREAAPQAESRKTMCPPLTDILWTLPQELP